MKKTQKVQSKITIIGKHKKRKFFLFLDFMRINFENFKFFLIITVKFLLGLEF
jgi:hypothetical protein